MDSMSGNVDNSQYVLQLKNIVKTFPGVTALKNVSLDVRKGVVHALVGENGAGKSTLMKIVNGMYQPTSGEIYMNGERKVFHSPAESEASGIAMIYQELQYVPDLTIAENLFVGRHPTVGKSGLFVDWKKIRKSAEENLAAEGIHCDLDKKVGQLSVSDIQMLEIVKVVSLNAKVIIMDEPTSSLSNDEADRLFRKINELRDRGVSIIYISHRMEEVFELSDYITVIRDGEVIETRPAKEFDPPSVIRMMVGRELSQTYPKQTVPVGDVCLEVRNLELNDKIRDISLYARKGEIVGIAGMVGAGRTEISRAITGLDRYKSGQILVNGTERKIRSVHDAIKCGIVTVTEDRRRTGFVALRSILQNIALPNLDSFGSRRLFVNGRIEREKTTQMAQSLNVKAPSMDTAMYTLSGGNQQKAILAKWMLRNPEVFIMDEPTRGIDVGAKYEIYKLITEMIQKGMSVIMISSELPELLGMCDRIYVMSAGRIVGEVQREEFTSERIMALAAGGTKDE